MGVVPVGRPDLPGSRSLPGQSRCRRLAGRGCLTRPQSPEVETSAEPVGSVAPDDVRGFLEAYSKKRRPRTCENDLSRYRMPKRPTRRSVCGWGNQEDRLTYDGFALEAAAFLGLPLPAPGSP